MQVPASAGDDPQTRAWDSAYDFGRVVLPIISTWLPEGHFVSVEDAPDHPAIRVIDQVAGIDGWIVTNAGSRLQGIASRIQYGPSPYESFTIRSRRPSLAMTELDKRLEALRAKDGHYVVPHYTIHAYVERRRTGPALLVMMVLTRDLFEFIEQHPDKVEHRRNPHDGTEFLVVWRQDLLQAGYEVRESVEYDITIQLRDGREVDTWDPAEDDGDDYEDDEDEVYGYWADDDQPPTCGYCGVGGIIGGGEQCPACGSWSV